MKREEFLNRIKRWECSGRFAQEAAAGGRISVHALSGSGARYFAAAARRAVFPEKKLVYIVPNEFAARRAYILGVFAMVIPPFQIFSIQ